MVRHVVTIDDLSEDEIQGIFSVADEFLERMAPADRPFRVRGRVALAEEQILATLFYEASTRTRFSFEAAMLRLGGQVLSSADPKTTSAAKGETLADTIRVVQNYADVAVIRHPAEGAVRVAADYAEIPVINAGDGGHEHPTQTLCDLYTLQREKGTLKGLNVALWGDLRNGRTVHSLVYGLARFGARILPLAAPGLELPEHVQRRLLRDYNCVPLQAAEAGAERGRADGPAVDVMYVTPNKPHQRTLFTDFSPSGRKLPDPVSRSKIDALYVTRLQRERLPGSGEKGTEYSVVDAEFLRSRLDKDSRVLHPLPRVNEMGYDIDNDERSIYFKQASYGVPVRMALMAALLDLRPGLLAKSPPAKRHPLVPSSSYLCDNPACITRQESEQRYLSPRFWIVVEEDRLVLRCAYCEHESVPACVGSTTSRQYIINRSHCDQLPSHPVFFRDVAAARESGFTADVGSATMPGWQSAPIPSGQGF